LLVGPPGGGKSELSGGFYRIFGDINPDEVATVPADAELSATQLVGGRMKTTKTVEGSKPESTEVDVEALINSDTKIIWADEINRANPYALNQLLRAFENRELSTTAGNVRLGKLVMAISTMNPSENSQGTFQLASAQASRHAMGAILGVNTEEQRKEIVSQILKRNWVPTPESIIPVITTAKLGEITRRARGLAVPEDVEDYMIGLSMRTNDTLASVRIVEADGRMSKQMKDTSKGLATLRGREGVHEDDVKDAVRYTVTARLGALKRKSGQQISDLAESIINEV
jgi:MoxR-like ATPase